MQIRLTVDFSEETLVFKVVENWYQSLLTFLSEHYQENRIQKQLQTYTNLYLHFFQNITKKPKSLYWKFLGFFFYILFSPYFLTTPSSSKLPTLHLCSLLYQTLSMKNQPTCLLSFYSLSFLISPSLVLSVCTYSKTQLTKNENSLKDRTIFNFQAGKYKILFIKKVWTMGVPRTIKNSTG